MKVFISTHPFGEVNFLPLKILKELNLNVVFNPYNRKCTEKELIKNIKDIDILIAGTDKISKKVLDFAPNLKLIARVGVGLDGIDLNYAKKRGIKVTYTSMAPASAVAELTLANMLTLIRNIHISNIEMHNKKWKRYFGYDLSVIPIGIIGSGKIGSLVIKKLFSLGIKKIKVNDIKINMQLKKKYKNKIEWVTKNEIFKTCKLISLHIPLYNKTYNLIDIKKIKLMSKDTILINTSRGGIINEKDLFYALKNNLITSAAIDVFENEPYIGKLSVLNNCLLTSHMGSMTRTCRSNMEIDATREVMRFVKNKPLNEEVPIYEYKRTLKL